MLPSEELRNEIEKIYGINLNQYAWSKELKQEIFSTELDPYIETNASTLKEIFEHGFNIGHCGLTSRYVCRKFENATLFYGQAKLLVGTDSSPNGEHAWTILNNHLIDTTLMISIPINKINELGYITESEIAPLSARVLSEYDSYETEFKRNKSKIKKQ